MKINDVASGIRIFFGMGDLVPGDYRFCAVNSSNYRIIALASGNLISEWALLQLKQYGLTDYEYIYDVLDKSGNPVEPDRRDQQRPADSPFVTRTAQLKDNCNE